MTLELMAAPAPIPSGAVSNDPVGLMRYHVERALELADLLDLAMLGIHLDQALQLIIAMQQERENRPSESDLSPQD